MITKEKLLQLLDNKQPLEGVEVGDIDFRGDRMSRSFLVNGVIFRGQANFEGTHFQGEVSFQNAQFFGLVTFDHAIFANPVDFAFSQFHSVASFCQVHFESEAKFGDPAFRDTKSLEDCSIIKGAVFHSETDFTKCLFDRVAYFRGARFEGKAKFFRSIFKERTDFACAYFSQETTFEQVHFEKHVTFGKALFSHAASFNSSIFDDMTYFGYTDFHDVSFNAVKFNDKLYFDGHVGDMIFSPHHTVQFQGVEFQIPRYVRFRGANLQMASFLDTDISEVNFTDCEWPTRKGWLATRRALHDELYRDSTTSPAMVEKEYRLLRKNYEERGNYALAGDFYFGEMEMRRTAHKGLLRIFSLATLYKGLSGYGEKFWRAVFWLFLFILLFAAGYLLVGLGFASGPNQIAFRYTFAPSLDSLFEGSFWRDYFTSMIHTLEVATFQREKSFEPITLFGRLLETLQIIVVSAQLALAVLALRRKFKR